ncbi:MAG: hypothetical protein ACRD27_07725 [Terracidiphilus sp.]
MSILQNLPQVVTAVQSGGKDMNILQKLPQIITAIGGLGTAAFGLVDSTKVFWGGVNRIGFRKIKKTVASLTSVAPANGLSQAKIFDTLKANWYTGQDLNSQKAVAKSLIKLGLNAGNAAAVANAAGVDAILLKSAAEKIAASTALSSTESDVYSRFDLILTALLDETYRDSDQRYVNGARVLAAIFAIVLAILGGWTLYHGSLCHYWWSRELAEAILAGLLATPLAPIAKDVSSAIATAVNTMQIIRK